MSDIQQKIKEIAVPLTGWVVTNAEAQKAYNTLMGLDDKDFEAACKALARHAFKNEAKVNKIKILLDNISTQKVNKILQRMLDIAVPQALSATSTSLSTPYRDFVKTLHAKLRNMGMGKRGALSLLNRAIPDGEFNRSIRRDYEARFGTDNTKGWDKAMHFTKAAWIAFKDPDDAVILSYGKEVWDEVEQWVGKDPEGWSDADIYADMLGIVWGIELRSSP